MSAQRFSEGDGVYLTTLKKDGVIHTVLGAGRYRVAIGSLTVTCSEGDLTSSLKRGLMPSSSRTFHT